MNGANSEYREVGALSVDLRERRVRFAGEDVPTSVRVFDVLVALTEDPGRAYTKADLHKSLYGTLPTSYSRAFDVLLSRTRKAVPAVENVRGFGYRLNCEQLGAP